MAEFTRRVVELTPDIIEFFAWVHEMIEGEEDAAMEVSDDLLQADHICGGLSVARRKLYEFCWYPESAPDERWDFRIQADEIEEIALGFRRTQSVKAFRRI